MCRPVLSRPQFDMEINQSALLLFLWDERPCSSASLYALLPPLASGAVGASLEKAFPAPRYGTGYRICGAQGSRKTRAPCSKIIKNFKTGTAGDDTGPSSNPERLQGCMPGKLARGVGVGGC